MPDIQYPATGVIEHIRAPAAWESDDPIEAVVVHGPEDSALSERDHPGHGCEIQGSTDDDMPLVPTDPTLWLLFSENFSIAEPELQWEYPGFAGNGIASFRCGLFGSHLKLGEGKLRDQHALRKRDRPGSVDDPFHRPGLMP
jgi:hypothetical protein